MRPYKTNSPQYLDYIASNLTREEIMANPRLCVLLENEYIKDNMELAIRWNAAKFGDYQSKYDFAEYLMCNGPEIDADTILHYRDMALRDPVITEIAYTYLSDHETIAKLRTEKYGKETDDCFKNPCFYLGRFSAAVGQAGDLNVASSLFGWMGSLFKKGEDDNKDRIENEERQRNNQKPTTQATTAVTDAAKKTAAKPTGKLTGGDERPTPTETTDSSGKPNENPPAAPPVGSSSSQGNITKPQLIGWSSIMKAIWNNDTSLYNTFTAQNCLKALYECAIGDWVSDSVQKMIQLNSTANVKRRMGDCSRLWRHVRELRLFDSDNAFGPITPDMKIDGVNVNGMYTKLYGNSNPSAADVWKNLGNFNRTADEVRRASSANQRTNNGAGSGTGATDASAGGKGGGKPQNPEQENVNPSKK